MYTKPGEELEDSRPIYPINFNYYHLGTAISSSLKGFEFVTEKTISNLLEGFKFGTEKTTSNLLEGFKFGTEKYLQCSKDAHAPFENFLKTWYYNPITVWWKTFAPPMFNAVGTFACEAKKWTDKPRFGLFGLSACGPFLSMLETFTGDVKKKLESA